MPIFDIEAQWVTCGTPRPPRRCVPTFDGTHRHRCTFTVEDRRGYRITIIKVSAHRPVAETIFRWIKSKLPSSFGELDYIHWQRADIYFISCRVCGGIFEAQRYRPLCQTCRDTHAECYWCNDFYPIDDLSYDEHDNGVCLDCRSEEDAGICEHCERWHRDLDEDGLCEDCARRRGSEGLHEHGYRPSEFNFLPPYGADIHYPQVLYMGVELESDKYPDYRNRNQCIKKLNELNDNEALFHLQGDSSLDDGFEVVSQPATLDYHKDQFPWGRVIQIIKEAGGKAHDTDTCGLHIHFNSSFLGEPRDSDENDLNATKLTFIFEKFWQEIVKFSRRKEGELREWAKRYKGLEDYDAGRYSTIDGVDDMGSKEIEVIKKAKGGDYDRYLAVNFCNHHTVEIRIFKGTLRLKTLFASLEFVDFLVRFVKQHSAMYLRKLDWEGLMTEILKRRKYQYLPDYLKEHKLCAR